jgi:GAF domain-containing protein
VISEIHELVGRSSFIAEASAVLSCSLEESVLIDSLIRLVVSRLADWCILDLVAPGGELRRSAVVHRNPLKLEWAEELRLARSPFADACSPILRVVRTGEAEICGKVGESVPELLGRDEPNSEILRQLGLHSAMIVPLSARNRTLGVLTLVSGDRDRRYRREDLETARELAHRAALAIENARLVESRADSRGPPTPVEPPSSLLV